MSITPEIKGSLLKKIDESDKPFDVILDYLVKKTNSQFGFIAEVIKSQSGITNINPDGKYLHCLAMIGPNNGDKLGLMFKNPDSIFSLTPYLHTNQTQHSIIIDDFNKYLVEKYKRSPKWPKDHIIIKSMLILQLVQNNELIGQVYLANRPTSYNEISNDAELLGYLVRNMITHYTLQQKYNALQFEHSMKQTKNVVLANISHEVRTPLNTILGMNALLLETELDDNQYECLLVERKSCYHLLGLITDILDINKLEAGKMVFKYSPVNIQELIETSYDLIGYDAKRKKLQLDFKISSKVPKDVILDKQRIKQMLGNLLSNAVKFTQKGKIESTVELATNDELIKYDLTPLDMLTKKPVHKTSSTLLYDESLVGKWYYIKFSIKDSGVGIKQEDIRRLFKSYEQLDDSNTKPNKGTGLGLAITNELCTLMSGKIYATSEYGKGSIFSFIIPVQEYHEPAKELDLTVLEGKTFLVVDDNEKNLARLTNLLDSWNVEYREFSSPKRALAYINNPKYKFDLGLLDIIMPVMDGNMLAERISRSKSPFPLIALSSDDGEHTISDFFEQQLTKPYDDKQLLEIVVQVLIRQKKNLSNQKSESPSSEEKYRRPIAISSDDENIDQQYDEICEKRKSSEESVKDESDEIKPTKNVKAHRLISNRNLDISVKDFADIRSTIQKETSIKDNSIKEKTVLKIPISTARTLLTKNPVRKSPELKRLNQRKRAQIDNYYEKATNTNINILVVEDQPFNMLMIIKMLKNIGYTNIDEATSGEESVKMVKKNRGVPLKKGVKSEYDLILMDIIMPGKYDGVEASKKITKLFNDLSLRPKIVAVTASVFDGAIDTYMTEGQMDTFISKPIDKIERITHALHKIGFV